MKIVGAFNDAGACERARGAIRDAGIEDVEVSSDLTLTVRCYSAEDREWVDELLRRAGSTGVWVT